MSKSETTVLCGSCKCAVETVPNPKSNDKVTCPRCGRYDRFDKVMDSVREYAVHLMHKSLAKGLSEATRGNRFIQFKPQQAPNRSFRWVCTDLGI